MSDPRERRDHSEGAKAPRPEAYVVQVEAPTRAGEALRGRVEHLGSGAEHRFSSAEDLIAFFRGRRNRHELGS